MVHLPNILPSVARRARSSESLTTPRPNLVFRKAKVLGKSVEELRRSRSKDDERISAILDHARILGLPVKRLTHSQLDKITDFQLHNGICLDASPLPLASNISTSEPTSIYLDNVLDPGNLGAIARSALFFGCNQIAFADGRGPSRITPAMSKASCGALESFRVVRVPSFAYFHETLKSAGALFVGTSDADSAPRYGKPLIELRDLEIRPEEKIVVVLGKFSSII
ncbi:RNA methyltransferase, TrmH family [Teladorsagia circumcincta]|uniref:RNA methyltransferase, TrmH family n=1 Tax=Teladorsagia circumcincta TaxID=45464 RepID=A0A2G9UR38_TELCI|nr:RNA methyltransferase, TrmH family [Teladorsagia circumcincta]